MFRLLLVITLKIKKKMKIVPSTVIIQASIFDLRAGIMWINNAQPRTIKAKIRAKIAWV